MRPIDADAVKLEIKKWQTTKHDFRTLKQIVDSVPTIEAEPVVRCEDCRHHCASDSYTGEKHDFHLCYKFNKLTKNKDFCSYGERRKDHAYY